MSMTPEEKAEFLHIYLDETEEELDKLVDTLLVLEKDPLSKEHLNEAFRMVHSMKGAAGMMGFQSITSLTHELESRFEKLRSGTLQLDEPTMAVSLRCVDYLRECNANIRDGLDFPSVSKLLGDLTKLNADPTSPPSNALVPNANIQVEESSEIDTVRPETTPDSPAKTIVETGPDVSTATDPLNARAIVVTVVFEEGLKLLDMKGQLVVSRVAGIAEVKSTHPAVSELANMTGPVKFQMLVSGEALDQELIGAADVYGVDSISLEEASRPFDSVQPITLKTVPAEQPSREAESTVTSKPRTRPNDTAAVAQPPSEDGLRQSQIELDSPPPDTEPIRSTAESKTKVAETVRVDIDRLDNLLNLAGELVVNRARFAQIASQMSPSFKRSGGSNGTKSFGESFRSIVHSMKSSGDGEALSQWMPQLSELEEELLQLEDQWKQWDHNRRYFGQINEAIDQLARVSDNLQRGVLQTRMVPVAPLFNRFKRVVRDLSLEREKRIELQIRGESTELDKRMIDELGDPLVHLVRNSIDHGMELPERRIAAGKPEVGTIILEASHSGNNIFIRIHDDGGGVDIEKVRTRIVERALLSEAEANELSDERIIEYIWHPGFSTAAMVTNISGRGVGMDIVKTRISELNGTIDVVSRMGKGSIFTIRLPLTLAIVNSLLFRIGSVVYSVPMDDVREIVSIAPNQVVSVHGKDTFSVRGKYLPLVGIDDLFDWNEVDYNYNGHELADGSSLRVLVLQSDGRAVGLRVDEMLGGEDIVIKSLSENFVNIRGLSGASILGDGTVSLLLDVGTVIDLASTQRRGSQNLTTRVTS